MDGPDLPFSPPAHPTEIDTWLSLSFYSPRPGYLSNNKTNAPRTPRPTPRLDPQPERIQSQLMAVPRLILWTISRTKIAPSTEIKKPPGRNSIFPSQSMLPTKPPITDPATESDSVANQLKGSLPVRTNLARVPTINPKIIHETSANISAPNYSTHWGIGF